MMTKKEKAAKYYQENKERIKAKSLLYYKNNTEKCLKKSKLYSEQNKEKVALLSSQWVEANREKSREAKKRYFKKNPHKWKVYCANRRAAKLKRTPSWLTPDDKWMIDEIYEFAERRTSITGIKWEVDHIIPLQGKNVSGFHVPMNLQVVPQKYNRSKGNFFN
jgi:hypothetical protein